MVEDISMINYSFIIPHKNSPQLLNRCVNSIPRRDDVEIIVVDDNSDPNVVDWKSFKFDDTRCLTLIQDHSGKGAGNARNVGIDNAHGRWLLFADADDYYEKDALDKLDKYKDSDLDILYFNYRFIDEEGHDLQHPVKDNVTRCCKTQDRDALDYVKYKNYTPWTKMVNANFVHKYNCRYECVPSGNDMFFSFQVAYFAKTIKVIDESIYVYIFHKHSQTNRNWNKDKIFRSLIQHVRRNYFYRNVGLKRWDYNLYITIIKDILMHKNRKMSILKLWYLIRYSRQLDDSRDYYLRTIRNNEEKSKLQN